MAELFKVNAPVRKPLFEGVQGENEARSIQFDITPWVTELGDGAVTATAKRSQDSQPYPVTVTKDGNTVTWKPTSTDTAFAGVGSFQLEYTVDSVLAKTCIWSTMVAPSLDPAGDPPDPYDNWLAEMRSIEASAIQSAEDAEDSADAAAASLSGVQTDIDDLVGYNNGAGNFEIGHTFVRGYIAGGNILPIGYRVVSQDILFYDYNIELTIGAGFRVGFHRYKWDDTYLINEGWKTGTYFIPAYTKFRVEIARVTENTSETADISYFVSQLSFTSAIVHELGTVKDNDFIQSYAHKGYALTAPECTASAYIEAKRMGYSGAECDIQVTADGEFVIWHDSTLSKLGYGNPISNYTLAQLQTFDFGSWKSSKYAGETILTFEGFVLLCKKLGLQILIDTKFEYSEEQITELSGIVNKYGMMDKAIWYINFNGTYLAKLKELYPKARVAWIGTATEARCEIVKHQLVDGVDYSVCLIPAIADLTTEDVERAHSYGISAGCYTSVDNENFDISAANSLKAAVSDAIDMGIDLIVSDVYRAKDVADEELSV